MQNAVNQFFYKLRRKPTKNSNIANLDFIEKTFFFNYNQKKSYADNIM